jgi:hypothetical protein
VTDLQFNTQFWIQILVYAVSFGTMYGSFKTRLDYLEKKLDSFNDTQGRIARIETSAKQAHHRIDELREEMSRR